MLASALVVTLLALNVWIAYSNIQALRRGFEDVAHTHDVIVGLERLLSLMQDAETGQRGYVITGDASYLQPYNQSLKSIDSQLRACERLASSVDDQRRRMADVKRLVAAKLKELANVIDVRRDQGFDAAKEVVVTDQGRADMDALRVEISRMTDHETALRTQLQDEADSTYRTAILSSSAANLLAIGMVGALLYMVRRHLVDRAEAAAAIFEQREQFRTTLASIGDAVITTDTEGRVTFLNAIAQDLTGWSLEGAARQPMNSVFHIVNEHTRRPAENPVEKVLRDGVIVGLANHTVLIAKDGVERPIDDSAAPIRDRAGEITGVVLVFRDVTERKQAEEAVHEAERQFRTLADSIPQLAWIAEPDGHISWFNRRSLEYTGTTFDQIEGWGWQDVLDPAELPRVLETFKAALASGEPWEDTFPLRRRDGVMRWHLSRMVPVHDDHGRIVRWFGTNTDVTEQREAANELRKLAADLSEINRRKDEFLATLAHELRNPLAPIRNALAILDASDGNPDAFDETRAVMHRQVEHMVRLIDDLLDVSRISRNLIELRLEDVELAAVVKQAIETSRPAIEAAGHHLEVALPGQPIVLHADSMRLAQIFANLLNNACKYTPARGNIRIAAELDDGEVVISVADTGRGIPTHMLPHVFEMFTQVERSIERTQGGLGIGLTLVKRLVEAHGGSVVAASDGADKGSTFTVRLPVSSAPAPAATTHTKPPTVSGRRVLVVDDNRDSAMSLAMLLRLIGNETFIAHDGEEAVAAAEQFKPDVILLDIGMPKLNGHEAARRILRQPWSTSVVLVALTGWGQEEDRRRSKEAGFHYHLVKPVDHGALVEVLAASQQQSP